MKCKRCSAVAQIALPSHHTAFCPDCFFQFFSRQVEKAIHKQKMFGFNERILVALSGGKDSLALALQLKMLGYAVNGLHIDLAIGDSSKQAREISEEFCKRFGIDLHIVQTADYGLAIPRVKAAVKRPICSVCGGIKRYFFNRFALENKYTVLATGHNQDDETARLMANVLSWDSEHLGDQQPILAEENGFARKVKPLYLVSEYETAAFCVLKKIKYGFAPCPYSQGASFTFYKKLLADLERKQPGRKRSFYDKFLKEGRQRFAKSAFKKNLYFCSKCGMPTSLEDECPICRLQKQLDG